MRDLPTIILRIKADLPITEDEAREALEYLDGVLESQRRFPFYVLGVLALAMGIAACIKFM